MKTHLSGIRVTAAAAIAAVGLSGGLAVGQYIPYSGVPQYSNATPYGTQAQQPYGTQPQQQPANRSTQQQAFAPAQQGPYAARPQYQPPRYQPPTTVAAQPWSPRPGQPTVNQQPVAQQPYGQQPINVAMSQNSESLPTPEPAMNNSVMNGSVMNGQVMNSQPSYDGSYNGYQGGYQEGCSNCSSPYPTTSSGYVDSGYGGGYSNCGPDYGVSQYFGNECGGTQWFGGVYYLFMNRDNPDYHRLAIEIDTTSVGYPYYPPADVTVLQSPYVDHDYRSGVEVRFGSTFTVGGPSCNTGCDPYGYGYGDSSGYGGGYGCNGGNGDCGCGCPQDYAWEAAYWFLDDDAKTVVAIDGIPTDNNRMYGMKNFAGLEYDRDGAGGMFAYRPVNDYYGYQMPVTMPAAPVAGDLLVVSQRVRSNFDLHNVELNFLRLPMVCGSSCGYSSCGVDQCGDYGSCEPVACGSPFSITGLCGVRYIRIDDDFGYDTMITEYDGAAWNPPSYVAWNGGDDELYYDVNVDNHLTGFQFGANMNYCVSCKCNLFWDTNFGLYNNHMKSYQRVYGTGDVRFVNGGANATIRSDKDDIAFVGEMRIGGSYDFNCHWRGILAYRAVAIDGVALSVDQMPEDFANYEETALIDSDGSMVIHGVQVGAECRY